MDGGTQIQGLQAALVDVINGKAANRPEKPFSWDEIKLGLTVGLNVKLKDPSFESQTKINLLNPQAYQAVAEVVTRGMNEQSLDTIIEKCEANRQIGRS